MSAPRPIASRQNVPNRPPKRAPADESRMGRLKLAAARETERREKDWAVADRLRDELYAEGWSVEDTSEGPILRRR